MRYARNSKRTATFKDTAPSMLRGHGRRLERVIFTNGLDMHDRHSSIALAAKVDEHEQERRDALDRYALMAESETRQVYLAFRRRQVAFKRQRVLGKAA